MIDILKKYKHITVLFQTKYL